MTYPATLLYYPLPPGLKPGATDVPALMVSWLDQTNTAGGANGTPVPACQGAPLPVTVIGGSTGGTFTDASVAPDGASAAQPASATQFGFWNGTGFVPVQTSQPLPVADPIIAAAQAGGGLKVTGTIADANSAAYQGVVQITPGNATTPLRGLGYVCTTAGSITLTLADASTITLPIGASATQFQTLPFGVANLTLGTGTAGTFWGLK